MFNMFNMFYYIFCIIVTIPLGLWKLVEIIIWLVKHINISVN
jgi:hypothetical protein